MWAIHGSGPPRLGKSSGAFLKITHSPQQGHGLQQPKITVCAPRHSLISPQRVFGQLVLYLWWHYVPKPGNMSDIKKIYVQIWISRCMWNIYPFTGLHFFARCLRCGNYPWDFPVPNSGTQKTWSSLVDRYSFSPLTLQQATARSKQLLVGICRYIYYRQHMVTSLFQAVYLIILI